MSRPGVTRERLVALFLFGMLLFIPPFINIFNIPVRILGIPTLYLYLFTAWTLLIALLVLVIERPETNDEAAAAEAPRGGAVPENGETGHRGLRHAQRPDHRHRRAALPVPPVRHRLLRRQAGGPRPQPDRQSVHLRALDRGLLHLLDLLRQRRPRRIDRRRVPSHLHRADAHLRARLVPDPQDHPHQQGQPHHLDRRFHRVALRQELPSRRAGDDHRRGRNSSLHLAAAQSDLDELLGAAAAIPRS